MLRNGAESKRPTGWGKRFGEHGAGWQVKLHLDLAGDAARRQHTVGHSHDTTCGHFGHLRHVPFYASEPALPSAASRQPAFPCSRPHPKMARLLQPSCGAPVDQIWSSSYLFLVFSLDHKAWPPLPTIFWHYRWLRLPTCLVGM
jgi:hypothetical protein